MSSTQIAQGRTGEYLLMQSAFCLKNELMSKCDVYSNVPSSPSTMNLWFEEDWNSTSL